MYRFQAVLHAEPVVNICIIHKRCHERVSVEKAVSLILKTLVLFVFSKEEGFIDLIKANQSNALETEIRGSESPV